MKHGKICKGRCCCITFPYSDSSSSKKRPALIISHLEGDDVILCQITSRQRYDKCIIYLAGDDFKQGKLNADSYIRPNRIFTASKSIILYKIGSLKDKKINEVIESIIKILKL